jgi:hypothetical protein
MLPALRRAQPRDRSADFPSGGSGFGVPQSSTRMMRNA